MAKFNQISRKHQNKSRVTRLVSPIIFSLVLAACSSSTVTEVSKVVEHQVSTPEITEEVQGTQGYLVKADSTVGSEQVDYLLLALQSSIVESNYELASNISKRLARSQMSNSQQAQWQLARAQILLETDQPTDAIRQLNFQPHWILDTNIWKDYFVLRSDIQLALFSPIGAAQELVYLSNYLPEEQKQANSEDIWGIVNSYSLEELEQLNIDEGNFELDGWRQLAVYIKAYNDDLPDLQKTLNSWFDENFDHSAAYYMPLQIADILALDIIQANHTALLLPLTGKYAKQAKIIRDGFIFALLNDETRSSDLDYTVIDSNKLSIDEINQELESKNIDFIVGPLVKSVINDLQQSHVSNDVSIPMLALNFPDQQLDNPNYCYFTLSPEQEAAQAALHLTSLGHQYPLILAPSGAYGTRITQAFQQKWDELNSTSSDVEYFGSQHQLQRNVNKVFGLTDSQARIAQMSNLLGMELEAEERSRRDIDSVYIIAKDSELNLIKPFISVAINPEAQPPALYANSNSNSGIKRASIDLSGVVYSDIPLLIESDPELTKQIEAIWPKANHSQKRLHALGMDAYQLTNNLPNMKVNPDFQFKGQTGVLMVDEQCVLQRQLSWAEYGAL